MVFSPGNESFIAAKLIFICDNCKVNYGSCEKFKEYSVNVGHLNKAHSRSNDALLAQVISTEDDDDNTVVSFLTSGSIIAIAADRKSIETFGSSRSLKLNAEIVDYGHSIAKGIAYMKDSFLEKVKDSACGQILKILRKVKFSLIKKMSCICMLTFLNRIKERSNSEQH